MPAKKGGRKQYRKKQVQKKKTSYGLVKGDVAQTTVNLGSVLLAANQTYAAYNFSLSNSDRAKQVAQAYQYYRIRSVGIKIKPLYDTYSAGSAVGLPNMYMMYDKSRIFQPSVSIAALKSAGCKPRRLDDKNLTFSFAPAVNVLDISSAATSPGSPPTLQPGAYKVSPWLPTNANANVSLGTAPWTANSVDHAGFVIAIEQWGATTQSAPLVSVEFTVEYEFKKRLWTVAPSDNRAVFINLDSMTLEDPNEPVIEVLKTQ